MDFDRQLVFALYPAVDERDFRGEFSISPREYSEIADSSEEAADILNEALKNTSFAYFRNLLKGFKFKGYSVIIVFNNEASVVDIWRVLDFMKLSTFSDIIDKDNVDSAKNELFYYFLLEKMNLKFGKELEGKAEYVYDFCRGRFAMLPIPEFEFWKKMEYFCDKYTNFLLKVYDM